MFCEPSTSADIALKALRSLDAAKGKIAEILDELKRQSDPAKSLGRVQKSKMSLAMLDACPELFTLLEAHITSASTEEVMRIGPEVEAVMTALAKLQDFLSVEETGLSGVSATFKDDLTNVIDFYSELVAQVTALIDEAGATYTAFFAGIATKDFDDISKVTKLPYDVTVSRDRLKLDLKRISKKSKDSS
uniref:DUF725 domain-containing protein n=1 Tax=Panagrellus redivivus TaxID=6233 RepID=A0A7E4VN85_PANRE